MSDKLVTIIPSRGRPQSVRRMWMSWQETGSFDDGGVLVFAIDEDDERFDEYRDALSPYDGGVSVYSMSFPQRLPMVHKLNAAARALAAGSALEPFALGFAGDDHLPRTRGWVTRYLDTLRSLRTGIVYGNDGLQMGRLCTEWAMTTDIVRALDRMVPADVEHMFSDNSVMELGMGANCITYLPQVEIEHMHPIAGKGESDPTYELTNSKLQYAKDGAKFLEWKRTQMAQDVERVIQLREVAQDG